MHPFVLAHHANTGGSGLVLAPSISWPANTRANTGPTVASGPCISTCITSLLIKELIRPPVQLRQQLSRTKKKQASEPPQYDPKQHWRLERDLDTCQVCEAT